MLHFGKLGERDGCGGERGACWQRSEITLAPFHHSIQVNSSVPGFTAFYMSRSGSLKGIKVPRTEYIDAGEAERERERERGLCAVSTLYRNPILDSIGAFASGQPAVRAVIVTFHLPPLPPLHLVHLYSYYGTLKPDLSLLLGRA